MHSLLKRQIRKFFGDNAKFEGVFQEFVEAVDKAYQEFDEDRKILDHSLELSSNELFLANAEMREIFRSFPDLFFRIDGDGKILDYYHLEMGEDNLFFPAKQLRGKFIQQIPLVTIGMLFDNAIREVKLLNTKITFEYQQKVNNEEKYYEASLLPLFEHSIIIFVKNISLRKIAEKELLKAKMNAENANRSKSEFLANMSHEIRTPMNAVLGFSDLLSPLLVDEKQKSYLDSIKISAKNLMLLINDILDLSKIEAGKIEIKPEPLNFKQLLEEIKNIFSEKVKSKNLEFILEYSEDLPSTLVLDEIRLRQIFLNLVGNAVKFTDKGFIKVIISGVKFHGLIDLHFLIEDTGIGISEDGINDIFNSFHQQETQNKRRFEGTGLGLAITKRLVEIMNGSIKVTSTMGKGSIFEVTIPGIARASEILNTPNLIETLPKSNEIKITKVLVVDDLDTNRMLMKEILKLFKLEVVEAADGADAVEKAKTHIPDLIFMDLRMPVLNGYEATLEIRKIKELIHIPIIALTASVFNKSEEALAEKGFNGYIKKPFKVNDIAKFLKPGTFNKGGEPESHQVSPDNKEKTAVNLTDSEKQKVSVLLSVLENEYAQKWQRIKQRGIIEEMIDFSNQILNLGKAYSNQELIAWANQLKTSADQIDIYTVEMLVRAFPALIEQIRKKVH